MNLINAAIAKLEAIKARYWDHVDPKAALVEGYHEVIDAITADFKKLHDEFQGVKTRLAALEATAIDKLEHKVPEPPAPVAQATTDAGAGAAPAASAPATDEGSAPVEKQPAPAPAASTIESTESSAEVKL